jgi:predicted lipoprotein with Yx(FWY)xxD motif
MKLKIALLIAVGAVAAAALIPAGLAGLSQGGAATVAVRHSKLGRILVDGRAHTLYLFERDKGRRSTCYGACARAWPPLIASGKPRAGEGAKASLLGTTKRKDGRRQVTYKRHPLYTFVKDIKKGQTKGEGVDAFGAEWYLVSPAGAKVESSSAGPAPGGYGG